MSAVFAAGDPIGGVENASVDASLTKILQLPDGTTIPTATFTFDFTKKSANGATSGTLFEAMDDINDKAVSFSENVDKNSSLKTSASGITSIPKEPDTTIFAGVNFPQTGVYVYSVVEKETGYNPADTEKLVETMTYSQAEYEITAYVKAKADGSLYIYAIATSVVKDDNGDEPTEGLKVDPTPGGGEGDDYSQMIFTNKYTKTIKDTDPSDPDNGTLAVSKTVSGEFGSKTAYFQFTLNLTEPSILPAANHQATYRAYVWEGGAKVVELDENADSSLIDMDTTGSFINVSSTAATVVNLKDGQQLVFIDTPVGTKYTAAETGTPNYVPSVVITVNGSGAIELDAAASAGLSTGERIIGEATNSAAFTNTYDDTVSPTGFDWDDLPYYLLMLLIIAAGVIYLAVRSRRKTEPEA
jgi:hypothetical protein